MTVSQLKLALAGFLELSNISLYLSDIAEAVEAGSEERAPLEKEA